MTNATPEGTAPAPTRQQARAQQRQQAREEREAAVRAARFDGGQGAQDGVAWRELAPGVWKCSDVDGRVIVREAAGMDYETAVAALETKGRPPRAAQAEAAPEQETEQAEPVVEITGETEFEQPEAPTA